MADIEQKLQQFTRSVLEEAYKMRDKLEKEDETLKKEKCEKAENETLKKVYDKIQHAKTQYSSNTNKAVLSAQLEGKTALMQKRNTISAEVFCEVKKKLDAFTSTKEYADFMINLSKTVSETLGSGNKELKINKRDMHLLPILKENVKDVLVSVIEKEDIIGGIIGYNKDKNTVIDESFAARLENEKNNFIKFSGLSIN